MYKYPINEAFVIINSTITTTATTTTTKTKTK